MKSSALETLLNCTQNLVLGALCSQRSGATAPAPLGPDCVDPGDARFCVRRHRQMPARDGVPTSLPPLQPARERPRRVGSAGHGRAKPLLRTTSPGVPRRSCRGHRAVPGAGPAGPPQEPFGAPLGGRYLCLSPLPSSRSRAGSRQGLPRSERHACSPPRAHPSGSRGPAAADPGEALEGRDRGEEKISPATHPTITACSPEPP